MTAHISLQGKGGVGKSVVASLLAQYRQDKGKLEQCVDTDPVNATLSGYKNLPTKRLDLLKDNRINESQYDELIETIISAPVDSDIVVDTGAVSFVSLTSYLMENDAFDVLAAENKTVVLHVVITGGQAMTDCLAGLDALATQVPLSVIIVVWLNEYFGPVQSGGKKFEDMQVYKDHADRIFGVVTLHQRSELFIADTQRMLEQHQTFADIIDDKKITFMSRNRLRIVRDELWQQLDNIDGAGGFSRGD